MTRLGGVLIASLSVSRGVTTSGRLQNVNGGHSGTLAFYFCPFWGACRQVTRACRQDYFLWSIFNYTEKS